jgi:hypothetical protein
LDGRADDLLALLSEGADPNAVDEVRWDTRLILCLIFLFVICVLIVCLSDCLNVFLVSVVRLFVVAVL